MGKITDNTETPIDNVTVMIKKDTQIVIKFTTTNKQGEYFLNFDKINENYNIVVQKLDYEPIIKKLNLSTLKKIHIDFKLEKKSIKIKEIFIKTKKKIVIKKDTTIYNPKVFSDGSEKVIEDLLKKLPGITVDKNGAIKFKGKQVTQVLLDNDNIFDEDYVIGTKNISNDIVKEIQAIEDYHQNPLLKGIQTSDKVAINLILKKGMTDLSANFHLGLGVPKKQRYKMNVINVSKKTKGFTTLSYNNVGENYSPFNFFSNQINTSSLAKKKIKAPKLLGGFNTNTILDFQKTNRNNNFYGSINSLVKLSKVFSVRINYNSFIDKTNNFERSNTKYSFNDNPLSINTSKKSIQKPKINKVSYELIYNINSKNRITTTGDLEKNTLIKEIQYVNNDILSINNLEINSPFLYHDIEYTYRVTNKKAFQIKSKISNNYNKEKFVLTANTINQIIGFRKQFYELKFDYLQLFDRDELSISTGFNKTKNTITSRLMGFEFNNLLTNNYYKYHINATYVKFKYKMHIKNWHFLLGIQNNMFKTNLTTNNIYYSSDPSIYVQFFLNKTSSFYTNFKVNTTLPRAENTFSGLVMIDNRNFFNNNGNIKPLKTESFLLGYRIDNFYDLLQFNFSANYFITNYSYINNTNVTPDFTVSTRSLTNYPSKNFRLTLTSEKYIGILKSTININSSYNKSTYQNNINNQGVRNNISQTFRSEFKIRTGFKSKINFENNFIWQKIYFKSLKSLHSNQVKNYLSLKYIKNRFQVVLEKEYLNSNTKSKLSGNVFLNAQIEYTQKNDRISYSLEGKNILGDEYFIDTTITDFSTSVSRINLLKSYFLLSVRFRL